MQVCRSIRWIYEFGGKLLQHRSLLSKTRGYTIVNPQSLYTAVSTDHNLTFIKYKKENVAQLEFVMICQVSINE